MANEKEFGALLEKLNSGDSGDSGEKECASLLQRLLDMQLAPLDAQSRSMAKSISIASPEDKAVMLLLIEVIPNNIDPSVIKLFKGKLS